jgi:hypothetical protein
LVLFFKKEHAFFLFSQIIIFDSVPNILEWSNPCPDPSDKRRGEGGIVVLPSLLAGAGRLGLSA